MYGIRPSTAKKVFHWKTEPTSVRENEIFEKVKTIIKIVLNVHTN